MAKAAFLDVLLGGGIATSRLLGDERLGLGRGHAQVDHPIFARETVNGILEMFEPGDKFVALVRWQAGGLVSEVGRDVTVGEDDLALFEGRE